MGTLSDMEQALEAAKSELADLAMAKLASPPPLRQDTHDRLTVLVDGSMLPGLHGQWHEAKLAVIFRRALRRY